MCPAPLSLLTLGEAMVEFSRANDGSWAQGFAGDSLNVAWAMRALLSPDQADVGFLTRVGHDPFSDRFLDMLTAAGLATDRITRDPARAIGLYTIETDTAGERSFSYWRGQSAARGLADDPEALTAAVSGAALVYFSGITLAILSPTARAHLFAAIDKARASGAQVAFDPNIRPRLWEDAATLTATISDAARRSDIVLPSFDDETAAFGDPDPAATLDRYRSLGAPEVIVKDGTRPTGFATRDGSGRLPVPEPAQAVDTTGAGDSFNGAYLAARLTGAAIPEAIAQAQTVSRAVVGVRGALLPMDRLRAAATGA